jgi:murein DD-endopeptidase MepM/ murein hydrolase activator NlpD
VDYVFEGSTTDVQITVIRRDTDEVVSEFVEQAREPLVENTATWDGRDEQGALLERGKLKFRIGPPGGPSQGTPESRFDLFSHKFPVRAPHTYGDGFGAGRGHKGQDVFASCGSRLEAARAGEVQVKAFQGSGAGYYVVIDGRSDNHDYVYMHLKKPASVRKGENVKTGETIGKVGASGNATGCHLHFEYWRDDWFNGGKALRSVTRKLKRWDSWS